MNTKYETKSYEGRNIVVLFKKGAWTSFRYAGDTTKTIMKMRFNQNDLLDPVKNGDFVEPVKVEFVHGQTTNYHTHSHIPTPKSVVEPTYKHNMVVDRISDANGKIRTYQHCGDKLAEEIKGYTLNQLYYMAHEKTGITLKSLHEAYDHLNLGLQAMNLRNRIRAAVRHTAKSIETE